MPVTVHHPEFSSFPNPLPKHSPSVNPKPINIFLLGMVFYCLFLFIQAPAQLVAWGVFQASAGKVRMEALQGTLWRGEAKAVSWVEHDGVVGLGRLGWTWTPSDLLGARLGLAWRLRDSNREDCEGYLSLGWHGIGVSKTVGQLPARLMGLYPPLALLQPEGLLDIRVKELMLTRESVRGEARLAWRGARSALLAQPLGDYRLHLDTTGRQGDVKFTLDTQRGPLTMNGMGTWHPKTGGQINLDIHSPQTHPGNYAELLAVLGKPGDMGVFHKVLSLPPLSRPAHDKHRKAH